MPTLLPSHDRRCSPCFDRRALAQAGDKGKSDRRHLSDDGFLAETRILQRLQDTGTDKMVRTIARVRRAPMTA